MQQTNSLEQFIVPKDPLTWHQVPQLQFGIPYSFTPLSGSALNRFVHRPSSQGKSINIKLNNHTPNFTI